MVSGDVLMFQDAVNLGADTTLIGTTSVAFYGSVTGNGHDLTINSPSTTLGDDALDTITGIGTLTTDAAGTTTINAATISGNVLMFQDAVNLGADTTLTGTSSVVFYGPVTGNGHDLTINSPTTTLGDDPLDTITGIGTLTTDAAGATTINAATISGDVLMFRDAVILGADTTLTGTTSVTFEGTVDGDDNGPWDLTLDAGNGDVTFGDQVGASGGLDQLRIVSAHDVTAVASVRAATLVQEAGDGTTRFDGAVSVTSPDGIDLTTGSVIFSNHVSTLNANGPLVIDATRDIWIKALIETGSGTVSVKAGGDVRMSPTARIATAGAPVDIAANGRLLMADGAMMDTGAGTIRVSADAGITVGRFVSETLVVLTSADGAIQDAGDVGGADIVSPSLALRAARGIGVDDPLETQVGTMAAGNIGSGGIEVANDGPLVIGTVDGLLGMANSGGGILTVANHGDLLVSDPVRNVGGGDTLLTVTGGSLTVGAPIASDVAGNLGGGGIHLQADGDIVIQQDVTTNGGVQSGVNADRGVILVAAGGRIRLEPGVTIATGTGQMTAAPTPGDMPPPVDVRLIPVDQGGSNVNSMGHAFIEVTVGDVGQNYQITIDWSNGVVTYPPASSVANQTRFVAGQTYRFERYYTSNPDPTNASAPIPVHVTIAYDGRSQANQPLNGIVFQEGGQVLTTTVSDVLTVPGTGLFAAIKVIKSEIVPVALRQEAGTVPIVTQAIGGSQQTSTYEQAAVELEFTSQTGLRVFFRRVDASGQEGEDVDLPPELIEGGLFEVFQRFPNGRYRIYLKEANSERERMIQELNVYQGRIVPADFRDTVSERQMEIEDTRPQDERPRDEPPAEVNQRDASGDRSESERPPTAPADASKAENTRGEGQSTVPDASAAVWGDAALAAGAIGGASFYEWNRQFDRAFVASRRSLTAGARLMRRLERGAERVRSEI
jgi:hypothetical protein